MLSEQQRSSAAPCWEIFSLLCFWEPVCCYWDQSVSWNQSLLGPVCCWFFLYLVVENTAVLCFLHFLCLLLVSLCDIKLL